jgi:hypothetical protein
MFCIVGDNDNDNVIGFVIFSQRHSMKPASLKVLRAALEVLTIYRMAL